MAKIEEGVRKKPVEPDPEQLAFTRNREDSPVLSRCRQEINRLAGDVVQTSVDYTCEGMEGLFLVDTDGGAVDILLRDADDVAEKRVKVCRYGASNVTVSDSTGVLATLATDGDVQELVAFNGEWHLTGS